MRADLPQVVGRRLDPEERYGLRLTLFGFALVLVVVPFSTLLFQVVAGGTLTRLDGSLADRLNDWVHRSPALVDGLVFVSWLGRPLSLTVLVGAAAVWAWRRGQRRLAVFLVVTSIGGGLVDSGVKILVDRPRPVVDHPVITPFGKSFPSGHAMSSLVSYGAVLLALLPVLPRRWRLPAVLFTGLLVLAIGSSRILLGVHFLTDVLAGYVLGLAWLVGAVAVFEIWRTEEGGRPVEPLKEGVEPEAERSQS
ncbi:MAG: phosphatase PAP2 family protein [Actinomycetota bacterium]|nr:phosphatase PAP2 family protein [Actinomycetota bacterium]